MYKGRFEGGVLRCRCSFEVLMIDGKHVEGFLEINFEALHQRMHGLKIHFELFLERECLKRAFYV